MHDPDSDPTLTKANRKLVDQVSTLTKKLDVSESECVKSRDGENIRRDEDHTLPLPLPLSLYLYVYVYLSLSLSLSLSLYVYVHVYLYLYTTATSVESAALKLLVTAALGSIVSSLTRASWPLSKLRFV